MKLDTEITASDIRFLHYKLGLKENKSYKPNNPNKIQYFFNGTKKNKITLDYINIRFEKNASVIYETTKLTYAEFVSKLFELFIL